MHGAAEERVLIWDGVSGRLLTATAPTGMLAPIAEACGSSVQSLEVIRGDPCRKNLSINVCALETAMRARFSWRWSML